MCEQKIKKLCAVILASFFLMRMNLHTSYAKEQEIVQGYNLVGNIATFDLLNKNQYIQQEIEEILHEEYSEVSDEIKAKAKEYVLNYFKEYSTIIIPRNYLMSQKLIYDKISSQITEEIELEQQAAIERRKITERQRKDNVKFNSWDITDISGITHEEMYNVLSNRKPYSNFVELSDAFVDAERLYGVNAFALAAISGLESGWNTSNRASNGSNNITGMAVYNDSSIGTNYISKYDCIVDLARQLKTYYLDPTAKYYNGTSTSKVNIKYCTSPDWYQKIDILGDELMAIYIELYR